LPESKRLVPGRAPPSYAELEASGHVKIRTVGNSGVLTEITEKGRQALAEAGQSSAKSIPGEDLNASNDE
jgi:hypothetical protein